MSKLTEWLTFISIPFAIWLGMISGHINLPCTTEWQQTIFFLPLVLIFLFGLYATIVVLYRTFTFNNCDKEAIELKQELEEARKDLHAKGILL